MSSNPHLSFLFVINKLVLNYDPESGGALPEYDIWHNVHPPTRLEVYESEQASHVLRYSNGHCERASSYRWTRSEGQGTIGYIEGPPDRPKHPTLYRSATVFFCSPHLPVVVTGTDASAEETTVYGGYDSGADDDGYGGTGVASVWSTLRFHHSTSHHNQRVISHATSGLHGRRYVGGRHPSWIPKLVPRAYANPQEDEHGDHKPPKSAGLGGHLPVVLGLMIYSGTTAGHHGENHSVAMHKTFTSSSSYWRNGAWHLDRYPQYPHPDDNPCGYYVHVCLDDVRNPASSTIETLNAFENGVIVSG